MLPFQWRELRRFGLSPITIKLLLLRRSQSRSFKRASGIIFLTRYAKNRIKKAVPYRHNKDTIIPHGINARFFHPPRPQRGVNHYSEKKPLRLLYVSKIDVYKHQWNVVQAVSLLRSRGYPVMLTLIGSSYKPALKRLTQTISQLDPHGRFVHYPGSIPFTELDSCYTSTDICLFASSCENLPNILLEGMASGLPIACSKCGPMPEVLTNAGIYFDPEKPQSIANTLEKLIKSPQLRTQKSHAAFNKAKEYSWEQCADRTFDFLSKVLSLHKEARNVS